MLYLNKDTIPILLLFVFIVIIGFWSLNSLLLILIILIIFLLKRNINYYNFTYLDFGLLSVFFSNIISYIFSENHQNSLEYLTSSSVILFLYFLYKYLYLNHKFITIKSINVLSIIIAITTVIYFFKFYRSLLNEGFNTINNFKNLYTPLGFLSNSWVSIFILFIPFQLIIILYYKKLRLINYFILALTLFSIIISFSRGAYLSIFIFFLLINIFTFRLINKKTIIAYNALFLIGILVLTIPIKDNFKTTISFSKLNSQKRSTNGRISTWRHFINSNDNIITGTGQGNLSIAIQNNPIHREDTFYSNRVNNMILKMYYEKGIIGIGSYAVLIFLISIIALYNFKSKDIGKIQKIEISIIFSGIISFIIRDLTFSSFTNNYVYFLFFNLIFLLIPYDIKIKELRIKKYFINSVLFLFLVLFSILIVSNIKLLLAQNYNSQFLKSYRNHDFEKGLLQLNKAIKLSPHNTILLKNKLAILSRNTMQIKISNNLKDLIEFKNKTTDSIFTLIKLSNQILAIDKNDDEIFNNIGWYYFALNKKDSANYYFNKAIQQSPYNHNYHISKTLLNVKFNNLDTAKMNLTKALRYSPFILESIFYIEFSEKYSFLAKQAKNNAIFELSVITQQESSPILESRLAILLKDSIPSKSLKLLKNVTNELPNMNRPWLYRAILSEKLNFNLDSVNIFYNHAVFLDPKDYFAKQNLSSFYKNFNEYQNDEYILNYKEILINYNNVMSFNYNRNRSLSKFKIVKNSVVPHELLFYLNPKIDALKIFKEIRNHYKSKNDKRGQKRYNKLIDKYKNQTYFGEEKIF